MSTLIRVLALIAALSIAVVGAFAGLAVVLLGALGSDIDQLFMVTLGVSLLVLTLGFGSVLAWHAWRSMQDHPSTSFKPRMIWLLGILFVLAVLGGHTVLALDLLPVFAFPPFHIAAAVLPPLIILASVGRSLGGISSWRQVVFATASGAFLATASAFVLEGIFISGLLVTVLIGVASHPGGPELLQTMTSYLQDPAWLADLSISPVELLSPVIVAALLVFVAGIIPLIEEGVKAVGVGVMSYRRPLLSQTFLWGLAAGAGFALVEGLLNTASGLEAWAPVILLRLGATLLHCFTGALMGLAWYVILARRRWAYALGLYAASVAIHSLWNALSVGMALLSLQTLEGDVVGSQALAGVAVVGMLTLLVVLTLSLTLGLIVLTRQVRRHSALPQALEVQSRLAFEREA